MNENVAKLTELLKDEKNVKELFALRKPEEAQKWMSDHGVKMSLDEVKELGKAFNVLVQKTPEEIERLANSDDVELTDNELAEVSGGSILAAIAVVWAVAKTAGVVIGALSAGVAGVTGIVYGLRGLVYEDWSFDWLTDGWDW